jgi:uncharacterized protein (UPF0276 family)
MVSVGLIFNGSVEPETFSGSARPDHVVVIPERFWADAGRGGGPDGAPRYTRPPGPARRLERLHADFPIAAHGLGLSIASACFFDRAHLDQLAALDRDVGFAWISEHLAAFRVDHGSSHDHHAGVQIPMPWGPELLELVVARVDAVQQRLGRPLLLENGVEFTPVHDPEMSETDFWCELHARCGVRILLDLHNLYANELNLGIDAAAWIRAIPTEAIDELHVAGGNWIGDTYFDSHCGRSPTRVTALLEQTLASCDSLRAVTFEFHESYLPEIGVEGVAAEMTMLRALVERHRGVRRVAG